MNFTITKRINQYKMFLKFNVFLIIFILVVGCFLFQNTTIRKINIPEEKVSTLNHEIRIKHREITSAEDSITE